MKSNWTYILFLIILLSSCNLLFEDPPPDINDPRVTTEAQYRLDEYRKTKIKTCYKNTIMDAEAHVDSLLPKIISRMLSDTTYFPDKPERPQPSEKLELDSSFRPVPIFDKNSTDSSNALKDTISKLPFIQKDTLLQLDTSQIK